MDLALIALTLDTDRTLGEYWENELNNSVISWSIIFSLLNINT